MSIARQSQILDDNNGRRIYRIIASGCERRPRFAPRAYLGLQLRNGQQQARSSLITKHSGPRRDLQLCQAVPITVQANSVNLNGNDSSTSTATYINELALQEIRTIKVRICVQHQVPFGQALKVVGSGPSLGNWQAESSQELQWNEGHVWTGDLNLEPGCYEFKCVTAAGGSIVAWEPGANRILQVPSGVRGIRVDGTWAHPSDNRLTVTEPIAAASTAARRKRGAAARFLAKALAEVNSLALAGDPSAAARAGYRQAENPGADTGGAAFVGTASVESPGSSCKLSVVEVLEEGAFREFRALLSPESGAGASSVSASESISGTISSSISGGFSDADQLRETLLNLSATAARGFAGDASGSQGGELLHGGNGTSVGADAITGGQSGEAGEKVTSDSAVSTSSVVQQQQPSKDLDGGWRDLNSASDEEPGKLKEEEQRAQQQQVAKTSGRSSVLVEFGANGEKQEVKKQSTPDKARSRSWRGLLAEADVAELSKQDPPSEVKSKRSSWRDLLSGSAEVGWSHQQQREQEPQLKRKVVSVTEAVTKSVGSTAKLASRSEAGKQQEAAVGAAAVTGSSAQNSQSTAVTVGDASVKGGSSGSSAIGGSISGKAAFPSVTFAKSKGAANQRSAAAAVINAVPTKPARTDPRPDSVKAADIAEAAQAEADPLLQTATAEVAAKAASDSTQDRVVRPAAKKQEAPATSASVLPALQAAPTAPAAAAQAASAAASISSRTPSAGPSARFQPKPEAADSGTPALEGEGISVGARFTGLLGRLGRLGGLKEGADKTWPEDKAKRKVKAADSGPGVAGKQSSSPTSQLPSSIDTTSSGNSSSSRVWATSWRQLLGDRESKVSLQSQDLAPQPTEALATEEQQEQEQVKEKNNEFSATPEEAEAEDEAVGSRFARLLGAHLSGQRGKSGGGQEAGSVTASDAGKPEVLSTKSQKPEAIKPISLPTAAAPPADVQGPSTPPGWDNKAPGRIAAAAGKSSWEESNEYRAGKGGRGEAMGVSASRTDVETVSDLNLSRLVGSWDAAWSEGAHKHPPAGAVAEVVVQSGGSSSSNSLTRSIKANASATVAVPAAGSSNGGVAAEGRPQPRAAVIGVSVNGGTATAGGGSSSGESLFSIAERLTSGSIPAAVPSANGDDSSPGITVRLGAMAAMGMDRQGSFDNRSSYLSQSALVDSLSGGGTSASSQEQSSTALMRRLRSTSTSNASGTAAAASLSVPYLPATPVPPGMISSVEDDDCVVVPPRLPATPPPPSYLTGPSTGAGDADAVPPLPATPVSSSILSGIINGGGTGADDLLRRMADSDAVLNMLRGNLPLTPIARGGRGSGAGPLTMAEDDAEEENDNCGDDSDDDDDDGSGRGRRDSGRRLPVSAPSVESQGNTLVSARSALQKLQQSAAAGLGLLPEALSETAARLIQQLPKLDVLAGQTKGSSNAAATSATTPFTSFAQDGSVDNPATTPGPLAPSVSQLATTVASGLDTVGSNLMGQLWKAAPSEAGNNAATASENGSGGVENGSIAAVATGSGLLSGLLSNLVGGAAPGSVRLVAGAHMIPHVDKVEKGGEDAYFISRAGLGGVAVADGVSGWADEGIDPADYPRTLMRYATDAFDAARGTMSAQDIIRYAQYRTYLKGSSTVCMALMKPGRKLEVANVGDSGVRILRNGKVIFGTEAQQHAFNMPFQLSHPNNVEDPDSADDADLHYVDVQDGDVIMLATDGLFDNVFDAEIEQIVSQQLRELAAAGRGKAPAAVAPPTTTTGEATRTALNSSSTSSGSTAGASARSGKGLLSQSLAAAVGGASGGIGSQYRSEDAARVARALAERAHEHARNPTQRTPWSVTSSQQPNFMWAKHFAKGGGKMDDCTVLIAFVCE